MYFCKEIANINKMLSRINEVLQNAAEVLAPPPTALQDFEYHWKQVKCFYALDTNAQPKCHINDTNIPFHLEEMLRIIIREETEQELELPTTSTSDLELAPTHRAFLGQACLEFVITNRPLDLLTDIAVTDSPPGATVCILNWLRRFLSCLRNPHLDRDSIFQPVQRLIDLCHGEKVSPYESDEILFLSTVAGLIRVQPFLIHMFLPHHQHSAFVINKIRSGRTLAKCPTRNPLFDSSKVEASIRRIAIVHDAVEHSGQQLLENIESKTLNESSLVGRESVSHTPNEMGKDWMFACDCDKDDRLRLLDSILGYFSSPDSVVIVRACEGALILASLPSVTSQCSAVRASLHDFSIKIGYRLASLCSQVPEDMDTGDIEDCTISWGVLTCLSLIFHSLVPRDSDQPHFIGRAQLNDFLCWLDYSNCLSIECAEMSKDLCYNVRKILLEDIVEPSMLDQNAAFMLVLGAKIVRLLESRQFSHEIANWMIGTAELESTLNDCLLTILIENAYENSDILLPTLQFIESLLDNTNERILHGMIFRYVNTRGYYDSSAKLVHSWSDEEDEREKRVHGQGAGLVRSKTMAPTNILKVINNFLLLLPRQIMCESAGTCYEEYVQDASRHYHNWISKTVDFDWPVEALSNTDVQPHIDTAVIEGSSSCSAQSVSTAPAKREPRCNDDSGISEETFYEGPLLRLLFQHVRHMDTYAYELNLAVIAILSKLAFLPHPFLHEVLLNPEIPLVRGTNTLWSSMQLLARHLLLEVPRIEGFQKKVAETGKRLLTNPPMISESSDENNTLFESLVVLEEFCKELAAIAFVKYHQATEKDNPFQRT